MKIKNYLITIVREVNRHGYPTDFGDYYNPDIQDINKLLEEASKYPNAFYELYSFTKKGADKELIIKTKCQLTFIQKFKEYLEEGRKN